VLQCVAVCCSEFRCVALSRNVLQRVAAHVEVCGNSTRLRSQVCCRVLQCVAVSCCVLQRVAASRSVL